MLLLINYICVFLFLFLHVLLLPWLQANIVNIYCMAYKCVRRLLWALCANHLTSATKHTIHTSRVYAVYGLHTHMAEESPCSRQPVCTLNYFDTIWLNWNLVLWLLFVWVYHTPWLPITLYNPRLGSRPNQFFFNRLSYK